MAAPAIGQRKRWMPGLNARIDLSHPLAQGLQRYCLPAGGTMVDLVSGNALTPYATNLPKRSSTAFGNSLESTGNASGAYIFQATMQWPASFMWVGGLIGTPTAGSGGCIVMNNGPGMAGEGPWYLAGLDWNGTTPRMNYGRGTNGTGDAAYEGAASGSAPSGKDNVLIGTAAIGAADIWQNGLRTGTAAGPTAVIAAGGSSYFGVNTYTNTARNPQASCSAGAMWFRRLSAVEIAQLSADPFCLLRH